MMDDAPIIFKRSKPSKSATRPKSSTEDARDGEINGVSIDEQIPSPSALAAKLKKQRRDKTAPKPKARVSFDGDDEGEEGEMFQVKKSNLSKKLALNARPTMPAFESTNRSSAPTYDQKYLSELKASTPTARPQAAITLDQNDLTFDASELAGAVIEDLDDSVTEIPAASSVAAAKAKRARLRDSSSATSPDDYISLSLTKREDLPQGPHPESRLVREEDELGEGDDEFAEYTSAMERIALGKKGKKKEAGKRRDEMVEMINDAEEEDEETMEWEREQLRRVNQMNQDPANTISKQTYKAAPIPPPTSLPVLDAAITRLSDSLTALTTSHAQNTSAMNSLADERIKLSEKESEMREMIANAETRRSWFAAFKDSMESVATFLDEKFPLLEGLEDEHESLLKERYDMVAKRRRLDDEDDLSVFLGLPLPLPAEGEPELDEFGRAILPPDPKVQRRERAAARTTRRAQRSTRVSPDTKEDDGYSTDSSLSPSDASDFDIALSKLSVKVNNVLSDVKSEEFKDPSRGIARWFAEWRRKYSDSYAGAWGGLGMVGAWEFWVRLETVGWDPLTDPRSLHSFAWYVSLYEYSRPRAEDRMDDDDEPELGPDGDLVSAMLSTAVVPRLAKIIRSGALDPYSRLHIRRVLDLAEQIELSIEKSDPKFQMLLKAVVGPFKDEVTATEAAVTRFLQNNNARFDPEAIPARRRFLARRVKLLANFVRWRKYTGELFGIGDSATRLLEACIVPIAETEWDVGGAELAQRAAELMPQDLLNPTLKGRLASS